MIDDTFIVTQSVVLSTDEARTSEQLAEALGGAITNMVRLACQKVAGERPQHRTYALSVTPFWTLHGDQRILSVTTIVALVPKVAESAFPWAAKPSWQRGLTS